MRRFLLFTAFLVLSVTLTWAQDQSASANSHTSKNQTTLRGCLRGAPSAFTLTGDDGTTYQLVGDNGQLGHLVGKEIMVKGKPTSSNVSAGSTVPGATGSPAVGEPNFTVESAKKISDQCGK
jgi:hypothetical protein